MAAAKLLDMVRERIRVKHYSLRTEDAYLHWIRRFIFFHAKRHPREMGRPCRGFDAESGAVRAAVPVSRCPEGRASLARRRGARQALAARAGGADRERGRR